MEDKGLGDIPSNVSSTSSIILFNSHLNLYRNYKDHDNLASGGRYEHLLFFIFFYFNFNFFFFFISILFINREKQIVEEKAKILESAPLTLLNSEALPDISQLDLLFKPSMGEMTTLALPENLPLDFIASKFYF